MTPALTRRRVSALTLLPALTLAGCGWWRQDSPPEPPDPLPGPMRSWPPQGLLDSAWLPWQRGLPAPTGFGLYTVLLARGPDRSTQRLLEELFVSTVNARETPLARENLNLIQLPVRDAERAARALDGARHDARAAAEALLRESYDFGQAGALMAQLCRRERGDAVVRACGGTAPDGPLLLTTPAPWDGSGPIGSRLLVVNLARTAAGAMREALSAYRRQVLRKDFDRVPESEAWRLWALNRLLEGSQLLPGIVKGFTGVR